MCTFHLLSLTSHSLNASVSFVFVVVKMALMTALAGASLARWKPTRTHSFGFGRVEVRLTLRFLFSLVPFLGTLFLKVCRFRHVRLCVRRFRSLRFIDAFSDVLCGRV